MLTVIVLTFNSDSSLADVVNSVKALAARVLVVDSFSTDGTEKIARELGCEWVQHPFDNYSAQRNWAQEYAALAPDDWVLHLDSDEVVSPELAASIGRVIGETPPAICRQGEAPPPPAPEEEGVGGGGRPSPPDHSPLPTPHAPTGYLIRRLTHFWGHPNRHGHMNPSWHLRLYRAGCGRCEDRLYDQHFVCDGPTAKLKGLLLDMQAVDLERWTATHNRWSTAEAQEILRQSAAPDSALPAPETPLPTPPTPSRVLHGRLTGDTRERKRWVKNRLWYRLPPFFRAYVFYFYSYVLKLGFLDGRVGFVYHTLHAFWFRFLIDAKVLEARRARRG